MSSKCGHLECRQVCDKDRKQFCKKDNWKCGVTFYEWSDRYCKDYHAKLESYVSPEAALKFVNKAVQPTVTSFNATGQAGQAVTGQQFSRNSQVFSTSVIVDAEGVTHIIANAYQGLDATSKWLTDALAAISLAHPGARLLQPDIYVVNTIGHTFWTNEVYPVVVGDALVVATFFVQSQWKLDDCCDKAVRVQATVLYNESV